MQANDNILSILKEKEYSTIQQSRRGLILQPGAIGDCILTLPLAEFMKESLRLGGIEILGHTEYIGILPGRTCIGRVRSMDSMDLHRLFTETKEFDLADKDPLIYVFADYDWIVTFMGEPDSNFEQNLIFTAHCSHSAEIITLSLKPPKKFSGHLVNFYIQQFVEQCDMPLEPMPFSGGEQLIKATEADRKRGRELLAEKDVDSSAKLVVLCPGSGGKEKCWHIDNFLSIAKELTFKGAEVIFLLGPAETKRFGDKIISKINNAAQLLTDLSLTEVLGLFSCADGFVGNDSGITHLAAGLGVKTLAVFGPTKPAVYKPIGPAVKIFKSKTSTFTKQHSVKLQQKIVEALMEVS